MRSCASREPALADRGGAHPQHHGSPAQATREGARPARVRVSRRGLSGLTLSLVADDGRMRVFVTFRDAERFVSDGAGTYPPPQAPEGIARWGARRAKRRGQGAVTGETAMEIRRVVSRKSIRPSNRALPASFRLRSSPRVVGFRVSAEGPDGLGGKSRPVLGLSGKIFRPVFSGVP